MRTSLATTLLAAVATVPVAAQQAPAAEDATPPRCASGAISSIELERRDVFEPDSIGFAPVAWTYRALNAFHVRTRASFVRRVLLVDVGDCYDDFLVSESERLLDAYTFLESARITSRADGEGGRALLVRTRDAWSTTLGLGVTYDDGVNLESLSLSEKNFLGRGILVSLSHQEFRETRAQTARVAAPRLGGHTDASVQFGRDRPGTVFDQYLRRLFLGDTGRYSLRQGFSRGTTYFAYATAIGDGSTQLFVPAYREFLELSAARRYGSQGRSFIVGLTLSRDVSRNGDALAVIDGDVDGAPTVDPEDLPPAVAAQLADNASTRLWLHLGARRYRYEEYEGLDAVRERQLVGLGVFGGVTVGRGFAALTPSDVSGLDDVFARGRVSGTVGVGRALVRADATLEARRAGGAWRDRLGSVELVGYVRPGFPFAQTLFARTSYAEGRRVTMPFQLSLGGRESVRSLPEDAYPGGRVLRFTLEDRIPLPWPRRAFDLGLTLFADAGRIWPGDAPLGVDSGWLYGIGAGVRFALPAGSRYAWRADLAVPVGPTRGDPVFRITFELNRLARGFFTPDLVRSRRFGLGAESF